MVTQTWPDSPEQVAMPDLGVTEYQVMPEQPGRVGEEKAEEEVLVDGDTGAGEAGEEAEDTEGGNKEEDGDEEAAEGEVAEAGVVVVVYLSRERLHWMTGNVVCGQIVLNFLVFFR